MTITYSELSEILGVSRSTISRVLNQPQLVKAVTREKVLKALEDHDYVYNALAGGLTKKKTATIGIMLPTITNPVFALSTKGIQEVARERGYSILLGSTDYSADSEFKLVHLFREKRVDGIMFTGIPLHEHTIDTIKQSQIPQLITWEQSDDENISYVAFDNRKAGYNVTEYLVSLGHRRIAMITARFQETSRAFKRWWGYKEALEDHGIPYHDEFLIHKAYTIMDGKEAAGRLLRMQPPPTAIVCGNDILAMGAVAAAKETGFRVGSEVSITGFDDLETSAVFDPPLTSVQIPAHKMGKMGAQLLMDAIEEEISDPQRYILETKLVIRGSTGPPA